MQTLYDSIQAPTLVLDAAKAKANIRKMAAKARHWGVTFRPHFKTHQSAQIGEWFRAEGVNAITVSSLDMAEYFARHGWTDMTVAFPFNPRQMEACNQLATRVRLGIVVEAEETVAFLKKHANAGLNAWVKIDTGSRRTGIHVDDVESVWRLIQQIDGCGQLRLQGLLTHAGHTYRQADRQVVEAINRHCVEGMNRLRDDLRQRGAPELLISVGDTPACSLCDEIGSVDEVRPGNFVLYDAMQLANGVCEFDQVAAALVCPVVAKHPERGELVIHGGVVHLSSEFYQQDDKRVYGLVCLPQGTGWGQPLAGAAVTRLSQEHGIVTAPAQVLAQVNVGDLVGVLPAHSCITVASMRRYRSTTGEWIEAMGCAPTRE